MLFASACATTLNVGMLFRLTGSDGSDLGQAWKSTATASLMAVAHFNTRNSSLIAAFGQLSGCQMQLSVAPVVYDTESTIAASTKLVMSGYQNLNAVIGPARSATSVQTALLTGFVKIPQIGYWASSTKLDSVEDYPYYGRVCSSDLASNKARMAYFKSVDWNRVGVLYIEDDWGSPIASDLASSFSEEGWELMKEAFTYGNTAEMRVGLTHLKNSGFKVFLFLGYEIDSLAMLREATALGLIGKDYAWMFGDIDLVEYLNGAEFDDEITNAIKGNLQPLQQCADVVCISVRIDCNLPCCRSRRAGQHQ